MPEKINQNPKMKIVLFNLVIFFIFCQLGTNQCSAARDKIGVVVSILPQVEFVEQVGGEKVKITLMIPPGANPHTYEPTPAQLKRVSEAKVYFKVGSGIEFELVWMDKITSCNEKILVVDCSREIKLIDNDPHIWLSPKNARKMVENICQGLIQVDPENKDYYLTRKQIYIQKLIELDREISGRLTGKKKRKFIAYHPAWAYFAREYGLQQIPVKKEGKQPTLKTIMWVINQARSEKVRVIFVSPQFDVEGAKLIANEIKGEILMADPLAKDYIQNMRKITEVLGKYLN